MIRLNSFRRTAVAAALLLGGCSDDPVDTSHYTDGFTTGGTTFGAGGNAFFGMGGRLGAGGFSASGGVFGAGGSASGGVVGGGGIPAAGGMGAGGDGAGGIGAGGDGAGGAGAGGDVAAGGAGAGGAGAGGSGDGGAGAGGAGAGGSGDGGAGAGGAGAGGSGDGGAGAGGAGAGGSGDGGAGAGGSGDGGAGAGGSGDGGAGAGGSGDGGSGSGGVGAGGDGAGGNDDAGIGGLGNTGGAGAGGSGAGGACSGCIGPDPTEATASNTGPLTVATYTSGWPDSPAYGAATIYYPTNGQEPYVGVAVAPGFIEMQNAINGWGRFLASHGFVVLTLDTNTTGDAPDVRATALLAAVDTLKGEGSRTGSPLFGRMSPDTYAIMGHSMGGGGTLIAALQNRPDIKATMPLTPWSLNPQNFAGIQAPTLIFAGQNDILAGNLAMTRPFYNSIPVSVPKAYVEFAGADHFVANDPTGIGANARILARYGLSWFKVHLHGDIRYRQFLVPNATAFSLFDTTLP